MTQSMAMQPLDFATFLAPLAPEELLERYWGQKIRLRSAHRPPS